MSGVRNFFFSIFTKSWCSYKKTHMNITAVSIKWYFVTYGTSVSKRCEIFWELYLFRLSIDECIMFLNTQERIIPIREASLFRLTWRLMQTGIRDVSRIIWSNTFQLTVLGYQHQNFDIACTFHWIILLAMVLVFFIFFFLSCLWS